MSALASYVARMLFRAGHDRLIAVAEPPFISANIGLLRRFEVASRERNEVVAARGPQRFDHFDVVATRLIEGFGKRIGIGANAVSLLRQSFNRLDQACI